VRAHFTQQNQSWQTIQPAEQANVFVQHAIASAEEAHSIFEQAKCFCQAKNPPYNKRKVPHI
jgi:hypothetical protein